MKIKCKHQDKSNKMTPVCVVCAYMRAHKSWLIFPEVALHPTELSDAGICVQVCNPNSCLFNAGLNPVPESKQRSPCCSQTGSLRDIRVSRLSLLLTQACRGEGTAAFMDGWCTKHSSHLKVPCSD